MEINGNTKIVGLFGDPVSHSLSPAMFNAAFRAKKMNYRYLPFAVRHDAVPAAVRAITALDINGVNVTAPHKQAVIPYLDGLSGEAGFLQAVNTINNEQGRLVGYNTDIDGFLHLLRAAGGVAASDPKAILLGAGGAAGAVSLALAKAGVKYLLILNRTPDRAERLASLLVDAGVFTPGKVEAAKLQQDFLCRHMNDDTGAALIINALSADPVEMGFLTRENLRVRGGGMAIDLRYSAAQAPFARWAEDHGMRALNGLEMLLGQGVKAFEIFTGEAAPLPAMREALRLAAAPTAPRPEGWKNEYR